MKIIKYGAEWCNPCKLTRETLKRSGYPFEEIDVDENESIAEQRNIRSIPVVEFYNEDTPEPIYTHKGLLTDQVLKEIIEKLK